MQVFYVQSPFASPGLRFHGLIILKFHTARLLLNLVLLQSGYPLAIIEKEKRLAYINAIEKALLHNDEQDYYMVILEAIEHSLDSYLEAIAESKI